MTVIKDYVEVVNQPRSSPHFPTYLKVKVISTQLCPTLCDPTDCSLPGSSVHGLFQARILERVAISFSRASSRPRDRTHFSWVSCIAGGFFTHWDLGEAHLPNYSSQDHIWAFSFYKYGHWGSLRVNDWSRGHMCKQEHLNPLHSTPVPFLLDRRASSQDHKAK